MSLPIICSIGLALLIVGQTASAQINSPPPNRGSPSATAAPVRPRRPVQKEATPVRRRSTPPPTMSYATALRRYRHERHDRFWWKQHYRTIALAAGGYYYFDAGYWYPAWGYDPGYASYDYDGPIYTYGNLLPDQVILNVQRALQDLGYYDGALSGSLSSATRQAIAAYQQDAGLVVTGVVDAPLVDSLGLQ